MQHYVRRFSRELGREVSQVAPETLEHLGRYGWPGNIRELQSILKQALLQASGAVLLPAFLPESLGGSDAGAPRSRVDAPVFEAYIRERLGTNSIDLYAETHRLIDQILLPLVLEHSGGIQSRAAALLGIGRRTLRQRLCELGLTTAHPADQAGEDAD